MLLSESLSQKEQSAWLEASAALSVESLVKHLAAVPESNSLESSLQQREPSAAD